MVRIAFSEPVATRAKAAVTGGALKRARGGGSAELWQLTVEPDSHAAVTVTLPAASDCATRGAVCTTDGRRLESALTLTVPGPAGLSVANGRVKEAAGAVVTFAVTLSRAASGRVQVRYATSDGSATAGEDYKAKSGRLTFRKGETSKTVKVKVLDDAHDEGEETFTLALSDATGARLSDGEATGTIENADLMPAALLARFGRATAEQVVEHIEERMAAPRRRGFRARFAGREFQPGSERDFALGFLSQFAQPTGTGPGAAAMGGAAMGGAAPMAMGLHAAGPGAGAFGAGMAGRNGAMGPLGFPAARIRNSSPCRRPSSGRRAVPGRGPRR